MPKHVGKRNYLVKFRRPSHSLVFFGHDARWSDRASAIVIHRQKTVLLEKVLRHVDDTFDGKRFAIGGLAFNPNIDDVRAATSQLEISELVGNGASVSV